MNSKILIKKAVKVLKEEGAEMALRKTRLYLKNSIYSQRTISNEELARSCYMDVLFINGCYLEHPSRYRISHQREQLEAGNLSTAEIFYQDLSLDYVKNFRLFIFFRCPYTDLIGKFIEKAKSYNKTVLFDIDDLMIDIKYTNTIPYVKTMPVKERKQYEDGVRATGKLLSLCDGAITTTEDLAKELKKYVPDVAINRNVASERMIAISESAWKKYADKNKDRITIGYFSGSITHNPDLAIALPALIQIMESFPQTELLMTGELAIPDELAPYAKRVRTLKMMDWEKLPELLASVSINIAPLEDSVFNRAKSENKWLEAALAKVPTIASRVGAFERAIEDGKTGILCENNLEDWYRSLAMLIEDPRMRGEIGENAYQYVIKNCTTVYTGTKFSNHITGRMRPNLVFVLPVIQISGGALVALKHGCMIKRRGYDVTILHDGYEDVKELEQDGCLFPVLARREVQLRAAIDKCVATLWSTCAIFYEYGKIRERYYLIQNYETDFYQPGEPLRIRANQTYRLRMPVKYITISRWCEGWLKTEYGIEAACASNGLDTQKFYPVQRDFSEKIRILIEGNSDDYYKNVDESFQITNQLDSGLFEVWYLSYQGRPKDWYRVDRFLHKVPHSQVPEVYRKCHILIKSSFLESFSYPPLEMMATGGCVVVAPNGGNAEYLKDRENCLFYEPGNPEDALKKLRELLKDQELRTRIIMGGIQTGHAHDWARLEKEILALYDEEIRKTDVEVSL